MTKSNWLRMFQKLDWKTGRPGSVRRQMHKKSRFSKFSKRKSSKKMSEKKPPRIKRKKNLNLGRSLCKKGSHGVEMWKIMQELPKTSQKVAKTSKKIP